MSNVQTGQKVLGIDLGTTNSAAAIFEGGHATVIPSAEGPTMAGKMFPSVVAFTKDGQLLMASRLNGRQRRTLKAQFSR